MTDEVSLPYICPNCGERVAQNYCPNCGQERTAKIVPVGDLLREVLDEFLLLDAKLWRTLKPLLSRPGFLTNEYIAGRRVSYVSPFRLYFVISALYFLAFSFAHYDIAVMRVLASGLERAHPAHLAGGVGDAGATPHLVSSGMSAMHMAGGMHPLSSSAHMVSSSAQASTSVHTLHAGNAMPAGMERAHRHQMAVERTADWFLKNQSLITFLLVPIAALLLKLLYRKTRRLYIEHLVFAVHMQSFMFALLLPALLPYGRDTTYLLAFGISALYLFSAMRAVYRQSVARTLAGCGAMLTGYLVIMIAVAYSAFLVFYKF